MYFIDDSGIALLLEIQSDLGFVINYDLADDDTITNLKLSFKQLNNLIDKLKKSEGVKKWTELKFQSKYENLKN